MKAIWLLVVMLFWGFVFLAVRNLWRRLRSMGSPQGMRKDSARPSPTREASHPGRVLVLGSIALAVASLLLGWVRFLWIERSGLELGAAILLTCWAYPGVCALTRSRMQRHLAGVCTAVAVVAGLWIWIEASNAIPFFNVTGAGIYVYLGSAALLVLGVSVYPKFEPRAPVRTSADSDS